jgi:hypothetical protein
VLVEAAMMVPLQPRTFEEGNSCSKTRAVNHLEISNSGKSGSAGAVSRFKQLLTAGQRRVQNLRSIPSGTKQLTWRE